MKKRALLDMEVGGSIKTLVSESVIQNLRCGSKGDFTCSTCRPRGEPREVGRGGVGGGGGGRREEDEGGR